MAILSGVRHKIALGNVAAACRKQLSPGSALQALQPGGSDPTSILRMLSA
jgi:hypothetical protein